MLFAIPLLLLASLLSSPLVLVSSSDNTTTTTTTTDQQQYRPPRDNLELSIMCANQAIEQRQRMNAFVNPDQFCEGTIGKICVPALFTLEECYAHFFAPSDADIPKDVVDSITAKLKAFGEATEERKQ